MGIGRFTTTKSPFRPTRAESEREKKKKKKNERAQSQLRLTVTVKVRIAAKKPARGMRNTSGDWRTMRCSREKCGSRNLFFTRIAVSSVNLTCLPHGVASRRRVLRASTAHGTAVGRGPPNAVLDEIRPSPCGSLSGRQGEAGVWAGQTWRWA